jgi:undecaprenyl-diphosphatase
MSIFQALFLGIVQGLTEFLPVSSSGHLVLIPKVFGWVPQPLLFDTTVHLGTALALVVFFWKDIWQILVKNHSLGLKIIIGTIPAALLGFFFEGFFELTFRSIGYVSLFLFLGSLLMLFAEKVFRAPLTGTVTYKKGLIVGLFQVLALFPGVSRSGATISGGMLCGLRHKDAARFSFLLSLPIVLGAGLYKLYDAVGAGISLDLNLLVGFFASFLSGILAIKFLMGFLQRNRLYVFVLYRLVLVAVLLLVVS